MNKYNSQLTKINNKKDCINRLQLDLQEREDKLFGKKGSMFYGLKYPTLFKICEYLCDKYKIPYDLMMDKIYHMLMKQQYESSFKFINYDVPHPSLDDNGIPYGTWMDVRCHWEDRSFLNVSGKYFNEYRLFKKLKKGYLKELSNKNDLYLGSIPYKTRETRYINTQGEVYPIVSDLTHKTKKQLLNEGCQSTYWVKTINKKQIIEELNKLDIEYKLSMKKDELMKLLVKNK